MLCRWDTTSLSDSPSSSEQSSPAHSGPTCEELLQQHEQQQAAAPLPRMDKAWVAQQHEVGLMQARQEVQGLLQQMQHEEEEDGGAQGLQLALQQPAPPKLKGLCMHLMCNGCSSVASDGRIAAWRGILYIWQVCFTMVGSVNMQNDHRIRLVVPGLMHAVMCCAVLACRLPCHASR